MTRDRKGSAAHEGNLARHETPEFRCYEPEETVNFSATWLEETGVVRTGPWMWSGNIAATDEASRRIAAQQR